MADAAMPAVVNVLGLAGAALELNSDIVGQPLPPPGAPAEQK
jgi:hypothetical protein